MITTTGIMAMINDHDDDEHDANGDVVAAGHYAHFRHRHHHREQ